MARPLYRVRQFIAALRARPLDPDEWALVCSHLPGPAAVELYGSMPAGDQRHALAIVRGLLDRGYTAEPLLQAALLHDSAKGGLSIWHRSAVVLLNAVSPTLLPRLASPDPRSWRYPFYISLAHPRIGAEAAGRAGADPRAVLIIRRHQETAGATGVEPAAGDEVDVWQQALKALDDNA